MCNLDWRKGVQSCESKAKVGPQCPENDNGSTARAIWRLAGGTRVLIDVFLLIN